MTADIMSAADQVLAHTYSRLPVILTRGEGCTLWDAAGRSYIDFVAGIAVCNLGHCHPRVKAALAAQAETLFHVSNLYYTAPQTELARRLTQHSFADRVFFCNSGAEANEAAIKLARRHGRARKGEGCFRIVAMEKSFHGRTMGTLSATGQEKIRKGFEPVLEGFDFVPYNDAAALERAIGPDTCAVILEPVQGEGGVRCPDKGYLARVRRLCDQAGILLIFDEVQTGMGRTGRLFAYEHDGVAPDVMTLAKALGNGLPIGAMLATQAAAAAFTPGSHASTFGGTPIITAAALEVLKVMDEENVPARAAETGAYFKARLQELQARHAAVTAVRGLGLLLGIELDKEGGPVVKACLESGFLINCIQGNVLRFIPPLTISRPEIDSLITCLDERL